MRRCRLIPPWVFDKIETVKETLCTCGSETVWATLDSVSTILSRCDAGVHQTYGLLYLFLWALVLCLLRADVEISNRIQKPFLATVDLYLIIRPDETHETKILKTRALTFVIPCRRATKINAKIQSTANPHKQKSECSESPARPTKELPHKIHS